MVVDTLEEATHLAYDNSIVGDIILLSPACASWDQFPDFEVRGKVFKDLMLRYNKKNYQFQMPEKKASSENRKRKREKVEEWQ